MQLRVLLASATLCVFWTSPVHGDKASKELKQRLSERYDEKVVMTTVPGWIVGLDTRQVGDWSSHNFNAWIRHYHPEAEIPAKVQDNQERFDDRTFMRTGGGAVSLDRTAAGERMRVVRFYVLKEEVIFYLVSLSATRTGHVTGPATGAAYHRRFGVFATFEFPRQMLAAGDYDRVVAEIDQYLLPESEYLAKRVSDAAAAEQAQAAARNIELTPGMTREDVIQLLGEPVKAITFGNKTILRYADLTVELVDDKVVEVKPN